MCKSIDAAVSMINKSIDLALEKNDDRFYIDNVKLHKLLYLAQCRTYSCCGKELFVENIEAHRCGPIVLGVDLIVGKCGFEPIREKLDPVAFGTADLPLSPSRDDAINYVLQKYGFFSTDEIVNFIKGSNAYAKYINCSDHPNMTISDFVSAGNEF